MIRLTEPYMEWKAEIRWVWCKFLWIWIKLRCCYLS